MSHMHGRVYATPSDGNVALLGDDLRQLLLMHDYQVRVASLADGAELHALKKSQVMRHVFGSASESGLPKYLYDASRITLRVRRMADGVHVEIFRPGVVKKTFWESCLWLTLPFPPLVALTAAYRLMESRLISRIWKTVEARLTQCAFPRLAGALEPSYRLAATLGGRGDEKSSVASNCPACGCLNHPSASTCAGCGSHLAGAPG
jgi:hypothetical protein